MINIPLTLLVWESLLPLSQILKYAGKIPKGLKNYHDRFGFTQ